MSETRHCTSRQHQSVDQAEAKLGVSESGRKFGDTAWERCRNHNPNSVCEHCPRKTLELFNVEICAFQCILDQLKESNTEFLSQPSVLSV